MHCSLLFGSSLFCFHYFNPLQCRLWLPLTCFQLCVQGCVCVLVGLASLILPLWLTVSVHRRLSRRRRVLNTLSGPAHIASCPFIKMYLNCKFMSCIHTCILKEMHSRALLLLTGFSMQPISHMPIWGYCRGLGLNPPPTVYCVFPHSFF